MTKNLCMFFSSQPPRVCDVYWTEFKHCKSLRNRLHHYYTYGTSPVCLQWKDDYEACREWERNRSPHAKVSVCCKASHDRCSTTEVFQCYCVFLNFFFLPPRRVFRKVRDSEWLNRRTSLHFGRWDKNHQLTGICLLMRENNGSWRHNKQP